MAIGDLWEIKAYVTLGVQTAINVCHYQVTNQGLSGATAAQVATFFDGALAPVYKPIMTTAALWYGVTAQRIRPSPPSFPGTSKAFQGTGGVLLDMLPSQLCGIITKRTAFAGKAYRGRIYVPFPAEEDAAGDGTPTTPYTTGLAAIAAQWGATALIDGGGGNTTTLNLVLFHRESNSADFVTDLRVNKKWATQRRRGGYGNPNAPPF